MIFSPAQQRQYREDGYVIFEGIPQGMLDSLRAASSRLLERARRGEWQWVRCASDIWGVYNLLHPDHQDAKVFAEYMASDQVLAASRELLGGRQVRLCLTNILCNPVSKSWKGEWHRDGLAPHVTGEAELAELDRYVHCVQWNAALYDDDALSVVPGSHRRNLSDAERDVVLHHPCDEMPNQLTVGLRAGEAVYYDPCLLHRGIYRHSDRRETIHMNLVPLPEAEPFRPHYELCKWMITEEPRLRAILPPRLVPAYERWLDFARPYHAEESAQAEAANRK
jgi:ectoine hydroxylase-related dioxygenase (phytanoyl-CoA dioxygenase family)